MKQGLAVTEVSMNYSTYLTVTSYGLDPSLSHGSLVKTVLGCNPDTRELKLLAFEEIYNWDKKDYERLRLESGEPAIARLAHRITACIYAAGPAPVAVDWDPRSVYWRTQAKGVVQLAVLYGMIYYAGMTIGSPIISLTPDYVRQRLQLKRGAQKEDVWRSVKPFTGAAFDNVLVLPKQRAEDVSDAIVLSLLLGTSLLQNSIKQLVTNQEANGNGQTNSIDILGREYEAVDPSKTKKVRTKLRHAKRDSQSRGRRGSRRTVAAG
jgi:Holliday junction resolvasome RuvABC endonuclease subunit